MRIAQRRIAVTLLLLCSTVLLAEQRGSFSKTLQVSGTPDVEISTGSGNITVHTGGASTVQVNAKVTASDQWFGGGLSAEERVKRIETNPPVTQSGNMIVIGRISDPELRRNLSISYDVTVPAASHLRTESGSG